MNTQVLPTIPASEQPRLYRPSLSIEALTLLVSLFFSAFSNGMFWEAIGELRNDSGASNGLFMVCTFVAMTAFHYLLLSPVMNRWTARPLLILLILTTAFATYYANAFTVYFDTSMIRNILETDVQETRELLSADLFGHLALYGLLPIALLWQVRLRERSLLRGALTKIGAFAAVAVVGVGATLLVYQDLASLMRNHEHVRYLITPSNFLVSTGRVLAGEGSGARGPRAPIGLDAHVTRPAGDKPLLLVLVVGETARAANWGLNGYARDTTPQLAGLDVINFSQVTACGTNTAVFGALHVLVLRAPRLR